MQSKAKTVSEYLNELPADRREVISGVREVILKNLDDDFEEGMQYGMIGYFVPHRVFPPGYHCDPKQPLPFACLASQKNYMTLHLMSIYMGMSHDWFCKEWAKTGKKLDMGKACIRFKKLEDLALNVIGEVIRRTTAKEYIEKHQSNLGSMASEKAKRKAAKTAAKKKSTAATPKKKAAKKKK